MELTVWAHLDSMMTARRAADIAERMKRFDARVLLCRQNITVNAKSLMGVVTLGLHDDMAVTIRAEGPDEAQAVREMAALLGA